MISTFKRHALALLAALAVSLPAAATSTGIDYTDQWWGGEAEHGWGVNFIEQGTTIFATLFVYGAEFQTPRWYVATMQGLTGTRVLRVRCARPPARTFSAGAFNAASVGVTQVGTMSVNFTSGYNGALSYTVNGVSVNKAIVRQSFANNNLTGALHGRAHGERHQLRQSNVAQRRDPHVRRRRIDRDPKRPVGHDGRELLLLPATRARPRTCTFSGTLGIQGVMGQISNGTFNCVDQTTAAATNTGIAGTLDTTT